MIFSIIILIIGFLALGFILYMNFRNSSVFVYRGKVIAYVYEFLDDSQWREKYREYSEEISRRDAIYRSVSYSKMMLEFWKPLDSFYPKEFVQGMKNSQLLWAHKKELEGALLLRPGDPTKYATPIPKKKKKVIN